MGQEVRITTDGFPGETFTGAVDTIAVKGESVSNVVTFETKIEVTSPNKALLKPEMTANVSIVLEKRNGVTAVPAEALIIENGKNFVEVRGANNLPERRQVEVGLTDGQNTEVTSGLSEGDEVARQGAITSSWQTSTKKTSSGPRRPQCNR